jgi:hypothetical protein
MPMLRLKASASVVAGYFRLFDRDRGRAGNRSPYPDLIHKKQRELRKFALRFDSSKKRFEIFIRGRWRFY